MKREEIEHSLTQVKELPTLFKNYSELRLKLQNPDASFAEVAKLISLDQTLTTKILRSANSPFYGLMNRISTVQHAIVIIGLEGVQYLVLNTAVLNFFTKGLAAVEGFDITSLWEHAQGAAIFSRLIAKKIRHPSPEEMFTAGLIHDIGKLFVYKYFPKDFAQIIVEVKKQNAYILDVENQVLGINHAEIGEKLLKQWNFPENLALITAFHHDPSLAGEQMKNASIVHLANIMCCAFEIGSRGDNNIPIFRENAWQGLGLNTQSLNEIASEFEQEINNFNFIGT